MFNPYAGSTAKERRRVLRRLFPSRNGQYVYVRIDEGLLLRSSLRDLSPAGMRLHHETEHVLHKGSRIRVEEAFAQLTLLEGVQGLIRWVAPGELGIQFDRFLPGELL